MVDYTTPKSNGRGIGLFVGAAIVVLVLLYALFAGGAATTTSDPSLLIAPEPAPVVTQ